MHELSLCQSLLDQVTALACQHQAERVAEIWVQCGPLAGVEPDLLQHAYSIARAGTVAEHAELHLESVPVIIHCPACHNESTTAPNHLTCPHCGHWQTRVIQGDALLLLRVELYINNHVNGEL